MTVRDHPRRRTGNSGTPRHALDDEAAGQDRGPVVDGDGTHDLGAGPDPDVVADGGSPVGISGEGRVSLYRAVTSNARTRVNADCGRATEDHAWAEDVEWHSEAEDPAETVQSMAQKQ